MKKRIVLLTLLCVQTALVHSQSFEETMFKGNHFSIGVKQGLNQTDFVSTFGNDQLYSRTGHVFQLELDYTFNIGTNYGILLRSDFGALPFIFNLDTKDGFYGTEGMPYFASSNYSGFARFGTGFNYHKMMSDKYIISANVGGGVSLNGASHVGMSSHSVDETGAELHTLELDYRNIGGAKAYSFLGININRVLKNKDLLGLGIYYEHFFNPHFEGSYQIYENSSGGTFSNAGNNLGLKLNYTFTQARKMQFLEDKVQANNTISDAKAAKKVFKKEKRYVDPKSVFISAGSGLFFGLNRVSDPNEIFVNNAFPSWSVYGQAEVGVKNNYYYEFGVEVAEYWSSLKHQKYSSSGSNAFVGYKLNGGIAKRFVNSQTNRNFFNLHAGVALSIQPYSGIAGSGNTVEYGTTEEGSYYMAYNYKEYYKAKVFPTLYLAVEKDFQLSKNFYIALKYKYDLGFISAYTSEINYSTDAQGLINYAAESKINGTAHMYSFGLKYKFLPEKE